MAELLAVAKVIAKPGKLKELRATLEAMLRESESEPGLLWWTLSEPTGENETLLVTELFADEQAYDHHETRPEITQAATVMGSSISAVESYTGPVLARAHP